MYCAGFQKCCPVCVCDFVIRTDKSVSTITSANQSAAPQTIISKTNRRHMIAVTQFILITVVYVIAFLSLALFGNKIVDGRYIHLVYYINHLSNFFIYLAVNKEFRGEAGKLGKTIIQRIRCLK